ncbi:hypothetical protein PACTADRAFT_51288 [Pachysolen tannophilus NRRL Y-2460]|uniref:FACT complex subunit POB3 n=1 Tax=Pachysolen tannophilus NRRL Y-2460 TaxID=669874 RepID=A0A1E4TRR8_PACTA|nr:hypothetical protein PACTADRAFT_51288 [Pachysolen tannophilus NRRL Y-2460]
MSADTVEYERIYLNQSKSHGRTRFADSGLGWRPNANAGGSVSDKTFLLPANEISSAHWSRAARGYELRVYTKNRGVVMLDGFDQNDFNSLKNTISKFFHNVVLEHKEHSLRGWNWGKTDLARTELTFNINNRPVFEIPYSEINNSNLTGKTEVSIELNTNDNSSSNVARPADIDELVEVRFYIPGTVPKEDEDVAEAEDEGEGEGEGEEKQLAGVFYDQLKEKADIGQVAGEAIVSFSEILFLTPRGRYDIVMYPDSLRLRGRTYDYKLQYKQIERIFSLPKPDDIHHLLILQIDPPLRQGQTRYPFLVMQFLKDEETEVELNLEDDEFKEKYADKLQKSYDQETYKVISQCLRGLTERRVIIPGSFQSRYGQPGIPCSLKANEGYLYLLERCFLFATKPTIYIPFSDVSSVTMSRTGTSTTASRTFDLEVKIRGGEGSHIFANIEKEEQVSIQSFCKEKGIKIKDDEKEAQQRMAAALAEDMLDDDDDDSEDADVRGSAEEDEESVDEDFDDSGSSDVAEEYDSDAASNTDAEMDDASGDEGPPSKKAKK